MRILVLLLALFSVTAPLAAQLSGTGPLTAASIILWGLPDNASVSENLEYRVYVGAATTFTVLAAATCGPAIVPDTAGTCQAPVPASLLPALNAVGVKDVRLSAYSAAAGLESEKSLPFVLRTPPTAPTRLRITK